MSGFCFFKPPVGLSNKSHLHSSSGKRISLLQPTERFPLKNNYYSLKWPVRFSSTLLFSSPSQDVLQDSQWLSFCQPPTILSIHTSLLKLRKLVCQFLLFLYQCQPFHFFKTPVLDGTNKLGRCIHSQCPWKPVLLTFFLFSVVLNLFVVSLYLPLNPQTYTGGESGRNYLLCGVVC